VRLADDQTFTPVAGMLQLEPLGEDGGSAVTDDILVK
jgi:hypothetical protein